MARTAAQVVDEAAETLARESRSLLGLPEASQEGWPPRIPRPPSALEFCQRVVRHTPVVMQGCLDHLPNAPLQKWKDRSYLISRMGERKVKVALTPDGRADDLHRLSDGRLVFALPHEAEMTFTELFEALDRQRVGGDGSSPIAYLQSQDSNLTDHESGLAPLLADLEHGSGSSVEGREGQRRTDLPWATEALAKAPDATNLWIGTDESVTSMHRDHYENLFTVIQGTKIFTLYPPCEAYFLCEDQDSAYPVYKCTPDLASLAPTDLTPTPWIPIDPTRPASSPRNAPYAERFSRALPTLTVEVHEGETLYLPAGWYHHVAQRANPNSGLCVCVNWWYESETAFSDRWALEEFIKDVGQLSRKQNRLQSQ